MLFFIFFLQNSTLNLGIFHNKNNYLCKHKIKHYVITKSHIINIIPSSSSHRQRLRFFINRFFINTLRMGSWRYCRFSNIE